jgi:hypothetical protein
VDTTLGKVFAFTGHGNLQMSTLPLMRGGNVWQADTALSAASVIDLDVGQGDSWPLYSGAFDNAYFTSVATGHLYVCANSGALSGSGSGMPTDNFPTLKRILFNANGTMSSVDTSTSSTGALVTLSGPTMVFTGSSPCSPVTEILNGATDWLFMSVQFSGSQGTCGGNGCVVSVVATSPTSVNATMPESGGTSGIVVDNVSALGQASSIYFSILANSTLPTLPCNGAGGVGCAVKATQLGLK